ncbi:hypothetical protein [Paenibacillus sp. OV219]|uniref:hypothetical protein n=1 Tax=Paenibacillus sp. OV219 TaxID=1884377 RepID=UPI0008B51458|nr:hypothetical protein [Paenibacillus sp. OV219]SEO75661.1 hypothetical protein SAMN05518847_110147 [Paenibacillus sp. OV219]
MMRIFILFAGIVTVALGAELYLSNNWMLRTYPTNGEVNVPNDAQITANWKGTRGNDLGMALHYADAPNEYIYGTVAGTVYGLSFRPAHDLNPGRNIIVTVDAGKRHYQFSFTTIR